MANEITSIFDYIFPRKKASDYQQTNLLDYGQSPESQNVYNPGQGDFGVMSLEGLKNSIPATVAGTLDFMYDSAGTLRRPDFQQVKDNVEPGDFNIYNAYAGTDKFQPFTTSFRQTGLLPTKEEEEAFRQRSMGYDLGKYGGQFLLGGMGVRSATGKSLGEAMNFAIPGLTLDLEDPNIGDALDALGMDNEFQQFLQGNIDENSTAGERLKQRFTNMLGEFGINVVADTAINTLKVAKNLYTNPEYREQALTNIGRDLYGDLPGNQLFPGMGAKGANKTLALQTRDEYQKINESDLAPEVKEAQRQQLWEKTGWWQAEDGNMHFEISDKDSVFTPPTEVFPTRRALPGNKRGIRGLKLGDVLKHDKLYELYPFMKNTPVEFHVGYRNNNGEIIVGDGTRASASWGKPKITLSVLDDPNNPMGFIFNNDVRSDVLHEVQHLIQEYEKFTMGSSGIDALRIQLLRDYAKYADNPEEYKLNLAFSEIANYNEELRKLNKIGDLSYNNPEEALKVLKDTNFWRENGSGIKDWMINNYGTDRPNSDQMFNFYQKFIEGDNGEAVTNARLIQNVYDQFDVYAPGNEGMQQILNQGASAKSVKEHTDTILNAQKQRLERGADISEDELNLMEMLKDLNSDSSEAKHRVYLNMLGEQQARDVQQSLGIPDEELAKLPPGQRFIKETGLETDSTARTSQKAIKTGNRGFSDDTESLYNLRGILGGEANQSKAKQLAPLDEGGYYMKSAQVILDDPREVYKQPGLLAQVNKKGEVTGELLNKGVKLDEIKESGLLNYLETKQKAGESVTKQELLDFIEQNRPEVWNITSFKSGVAPDSGINIPELDNPKDFGWNEEFGVFDDNSHENANFKFFEPEEVNYDLEEEAYQAVDMMLNPNSGGYEGKGRVITVQNMLKKLDKDARLLPATEVEKFIDRNNIQNTDTDIKLLSDYLNVTVDDFYEAMSDVARMNYYRNPEVRWTIPVETEKGTIKYEVYAKPFTSGIKEYDIQAVFPGDGFIEEVATTNNFNDVQVRIANSVNNFVGGTGRVRGVDWFKYVQGNTDPDTYREVVIKLDQDGLVTSNIDFHGLAGLTSRETKNMIGHMRIDNRIDKQGRKHTHSGEHQSDWAQQARQFGVTQEEFDKKLENAYTAYTKANDNLNEIRKIKQDGQKLGAEEELKVSPYISVGSKVDRERSANRVMGVRPEHKDLVLDKPMIDQYINRLKKFVIDEGIDDEVGMHIVTKSDGTPEKRILKKESFLANNIEALYGNRKVRSLGANPERYPTTQEVIERFKNGNPTVMDLKLAYLNATDISNHFNHLVNNGRAGLDKQNLLSKVFGSDENYMHNGKEYRLLDLNQTIRKTIFADSDEIKDQTIQKYAESKGVKGDLYALEDKIIEDYERTETKKSKLERFGSGIGGTRPPLINQDRQTKLMLKELIKQGIKDGSDVVSWTPSINQIELWGEQNATLFRKTYDKDSLKFGNEILKEYGLDQKVKTEGATIDYGTMKSFSGKTVEQGERDVMYIELTPELKKAVMNEAPDASDLKPTHQAQSDKAFRQPLYAVPPIGLIGMPNEDNGRIDTNKGLLQ